MLNQRINLPTFNFNKGFEKARYSFGAEDGIVENLIIKKYSFKRIVAIGGSGLRCLSYLENDLEASLFLSDKNEQVWIWNLWYKTLTSCTYHDFLFFWGMPPFDERKMGKRRRKILKSLDLDLETHEYLVKWFEQNNWECLTFDGRFEQGLKKFSNMIKMTFGKKYDDIFKYLNVEEQKEFVDKFFPMKKWLLVLGIYAQSSVVNNFIWQRQTLKSHDPINMFSVYKKGFDYLFKNSLARENFFMHMCFFGMIYHPDGLLDFMKKENFQKINTSVKDSFSFMSKKTKNIESELEEISPIDLISISDQSSFVNSVDADDLFQKVRRYLAPKGLIIWRSVGRTVSPHQPGYKEVTEKYLIPISSDKVQLQRFQIFQAI